MTQRERGQLVQLKEEFQKFFKEQEHTNEQVTLELQKLNRGLYGDDINNRPGLIQRQNKDDDRYKDHESRIKNLEALDSNRRLIIRTGTIVAGIVVLLVLLLTGQIDMGTIYNIFK